MLRFIQDIGICMNKFRGSVIVELTHTPVHKYMFLIFSCNAIGFVKKLP